MLSRVSPPCDPGQVVCCSDTPGAGVDMGPGGGEDREEEDQLSWELTQAGTIRCRISKCDTIVSVNGPRVSREYG